MAACQVCVVSMLLPLVLLLLPLVSLVLPLLLLAWLPLLLTMLASLLPPQVWPHQHQLQLLLFAGWQRLQNPCLAAHYHAAHDLL